MQANLRSKQSSWKSASAHGGRREVNATRPEEGARGQKKKEEKKKDWCESEEQGEPKQEVDNDQKEEKEFKKSSDRTKEEVKGNEIASILYVSSD